MDALYFRVSSERQTTENQFDDVFGAAEGDWKPARAWMDSCVICEDRPSGKASYRVDPKVAELLASQYRVYVEHHSAKKGQVRPMFERMKEDARAKKFDRLIVWKVTRMGRDMRDIISTVYELSDLGVTVFPVRSQTGPVNSSMGRLLWAMQAWFAEMENSEKSEAIREGQSRAKKGGVRMGRPKRIFDREVLVRMRDNQKMSWSQISRSMGIPRASAMRAYKESRP